MSTVDLDKDLLRRQKDELLAALRDAGAVVKGNAIACPFHEDKHPSGSVYVGEDGAWRFKCQAQSCGFCGDVFDVMAKHRGQNVEDVLREWRESRQPQHQAAPAPAPRPPRVFATLDELRKSVEAYTTVEQVYSYTRPDTRVVELVVIRCRDRNGKKTFLQYHPVDGGFTIGAPPKPWPLYNRTRIRGAQAVVVVEGEKCVHALAKIGVPATTSPCGAGKAESADWTPLAGKIVYLWPDADPPDPKTGRRTGIEHMEQVQGMLEKLDPSPSINWLDPDILGLPPKGDAVDFIALLDAGTDPQTEVWMILRELSESRGDAADLERMLSDTISGRRTSIAWANFPELSRLAKALFPGTTTLVCGDPGSSKSFLVLQAAFEWHNAGIKVALYELEDKRQNHLLRAMAQIAGESNLTDDVWVRKNPERVREISRVYRGAIESFARVLTVPGEQHPTPDDLADWVEQQANAGAKVIIIDPITYAAFSDKPWADDKKFLWRAQKTLERTGARLIIVTHPRKSSGKGGSLLDDMAGGAAYPRHAQTVLWLQRKEPPAYYPVKVKYGTTTPVALNRIIKIAKARNGVGTGCWVGFRFEPSSLCFAEQGAIEKNKEVTVQEPE